MCDFRKPRLDHNGQDPWHNFHSDPCFPPEGDVSTLKETSTPTWLEGIDAHSLGGEFKGQVLGHFVLGSFGDAIGPKPLCRNNGQDGRDVDDRSLWPT